MAKKESNSTYKVPVLLEFHKENSITFLHELFENLDVLAAYIHKSEEWMYGIYQGADYVGYLHFGDLNRSVQEMIVKDIFPLDKNDLKDYVKRFTGRVDYHESNANAWRYLGELDERKIIQNLKK